MSDDKKVIFSMVGVSKNTPQGKQIIKNIYLSFYYGAKIGIIGLNGSGKSTVMKIIAGIDKLFQGDGTKKGSASGAFSKALKKLINSGRTKDAAQNEERERIVNEHCRIGHFHPHGFRTRLTMNLSKQHITMR